VALEQSFEDKKTDREVVETLCKVGPLMGVGDLGEAEKKKKKKKKTKKKKKEKENKRMKRNILLEEFNLRKSIQLKKSEHYNESDEKKLLAKKIEVPGTKEGNSGLGGPLPVNRTKLPYAREENG